MISVLLASAIGTTAFFYDGHECNSVKTEIVDKVLKRKHPKIEKVNDKTYLLRYRYSGAVYKDSIYFKDKDECKLVGPKIDKILKIKRKFEVESKIENLKASLIENEGDANKTKEIKENISELEGFLEELSR